MNFSCFTYASRDPDSDPEYLSTGSANVDELLGGGVCSGEIMEVFGEQGTGKTQLALSLCRSASMNGGSALVIDADGSVDIQRLREMEVLEDAVHIVRMCNADRIIACLIHVLPKMLVKIGNVRVLVLDSMAVVSRAATMDHPIKRCQILAGRLGYLGNRYNCAVVVINDAKSVAETQAILQSDSEHPVVPTAAMGVQWTHICPTRLALVTDMYGTRQAVLVKSARQACGHTTFDIGPSGICDIY